jgi:hypothetical protein
MVNAARPTAVDPIYLPEATNLMLAFLHEQ